GTVSTSVTGAGGAGFVSPGVVKDRTTSEAAKPVRIRMRSSCQGGQRRAQCAIPDRSSGRTGLTIVAEAAAARGVFAGSVLGTGNEQHALAPFAHERAAMQRAQAVAVDRGEMLGGRIALVLREAVVGKLDI